MVDTGHDSFKSEDLSVKILNNIERSALYIAPFPPDIKLSCREWVLLSKQLIQTTYGLVSVGRVY